MTSAGESTTPEPIKFLLSIGAEWPDRFYDTNIGQCWPVRAVTAALASGCAWGVWKCADLAPEHFDSDSGDGDHSDANCRGYCDRKNAAELFAWAQENGCPCTCEADAAAATQVAAAVQAAAAAVAAAIMEAAVALTLATTARVAVAAVAAAVEGRDLCQHQQ
jgi:hypothetical protein